MPRRLPVFSPFLVVLAVIAGGRDIVSAETDLLVRQTEALSVAEQLQGFHLPEGFRIELFADEGLIGGKPINMAFDARGRLWVSSTQEYPYAVPRNRWSPDTTAAPGSKDSIRILEDTDGDGRADRVTVFADDLNIPTGVLPYRKGCLAWSIPNVMYLEDSDGDGKCDRRTIVLGPLGYEKDTHGMISSLRLGLDGWVYATHGFNNTSSIKAGDGSTLQLHSGNTFRFRPDGSRVERWTHGQVNPFGLCWDSWGNLYSADCHSSPIYQLICGAYYPSFGKPDGGLGFAPVMCRHSHGSTGIAGAVYLDGGVWGPEWDHHTFLGNPVTSKVNHDKVTFQGTTPTAHEQPDFITCDDPWFRPVDLQLGPDSALYIADFYNRIIGHYEVALDHPGRDRTRGRIWRVVKEGHTGRLADCKITTMKAGELMQELASPNLTRRYLATEELVTRIGRRALTLAREELTGEAEPENAPLVSEYVVRELASEDPVGIQDMHALWVAFRLGDTGLPFRVARALMVGAPVLDENAERLSVACLNAIGEKPTLFQGNDAAEGEDMVCHVQFDDRGRFSMRAGALAMVRHAADFEELPLMIYPMQTGAGPDSHWLLDSGDEALILVWRMAVREWLAQPGSFARMENLGFPHTKRRDDEFARIATTIDTAEAAEWLLEHVMRWGSASDGLPEKLTHLAKHLPPVRLPEVIRLAREHFGNDIDSQIELHAAIREGAGESGDGDEMKVWTLELSAKLLDLLKAPEAGTWRLTVPDGATGTNPWHAKAVRCADGAERVLLDSHPPGGEKLTGTVRSGEFDLPVWFSFWIAGHRGFPKESPHGRNQVRLVDAATGRELARAHPPRSDVAEQVVWSVDEDTASGEGGGQLSRGSGRVYLEMTDGDTGSAFAWMAAGGFEPEVPELALPPDARVREARLRALVELCPPRAGMAEAETFLRELPGKAALQPVTRMALAQWMARDAAEPWVAPVAPLAADGGLAATVFDVLRSSGEVEKRLGLAFRNLPFRSQTRLAGVLASSREGAERLLGLAPARVLAEPLVSGRLKALKAPEISARLEAIVAKLPPANDSAKSLIAARLKSFASASPSEERGKVMFQTHCAVCHRVGVVGNLVGPQLDGIGTRGAERLLEDVLDPNRAVDPAFRLHFVKQKNGELLTGLFRSEQDGVAVYADAAGQEHHVSKADIVEEEVSEFSLMPAGYGELLPEKDLHDLLAYLLARK